MLNMLLHLIQSLSHSLPKKKSKNISLLLFISFENGNLDGKEWKNNMTTHWFLQCHVHCL